MKWIAILLVVLAALAAPPAVPVLASEPDWGNLSVVWPHDGQGRPTAVARSRAINLSVWPRAQVGCAERPSPLALWMAQDNEPAEIIRDDGELILRSFQNAAFPSLEYNDIPADLARYPNSQYRFFLGPGRSNVWVHAGDARTFMPQQFVPAGYSGPTPSELDTRIQVVYPHSGGTLVNVAVDLFEHQTRRSVPLTYQPPSAPVLWIAQANGLPVPFVSFERVSYSANGQSFPRWVFNDVPVQPGGQYHFLVDVAGVRTYPTIWTHARDARTFLPRPQPPAGCFSGPEPAPVACERALAGREAQLSAAFPGLGCPTTAEYSTTTARQPFQDGQMMWRSDTGTVYVLHNDGSWQSFLDTWRDGQPESDPSLVAPPGLWQPLRGFGKVWREQLGGPGTRLGWATAEEQGLSALIQPWEGGLVFRFGGETLVLVNGDHWQRYP